MSVVFTPEGSYLVHPNGSRSFLGTWEDIYRSFREGVRRMLNDARYASMPGMPRPYELSSKYSGDYVSAIVDGETEQWFDEEIGSTDQLGYYGLSTGPFPIDHLFDIMIRTGYNLSVEQVQELTRMAGCITYMNDSGFVTVATYPTTAELDAAWARVEALYAEYDRRCEVCDEPLEEGDEPDDNGLCQHCDPEGDDTDA